MAGLTELLGMTSQLAATDSRYINSIEAPAILFLDDIPVILQGVKKETLIIAHPHYGLQKFSISDVKETIGDKIRYVCKTCKVHQNLNSGGNWFTPLLKNIARH